MPSRPILQACAKSVGPSPSICSASAANVGFVFVLLQRVAHALGVGEGCAVTASYPEVRRDHHHANSFRTAPSLCADMIFGKNRAFRGIFGRPLPIQICFADVLDLTQPA